MNRFWYNFSDVFNTGNVNIIMGLNICLGDKKYRKIQFLRSVRLVLNSRTSVLSKPGLASLRSLIR